MHVFDPNFTSNGFEPSATAPQPVAEPSCSYGGRRQGVAQAAAP
jgi:hypothetical protein